MMSIRLFVFFLALPTAAWAHSWEIKAPVHYRQYTEFDDSGKQLNKETGPLIGVSSALLLNFASIKLKSEMSWSSGTQDYSGATQGGAPLHTDTKQEISALSQSFIWAPEAFAGYFFHASLGWNQWDRHIQASPNSLALKERYRWWSSTFGFGYVNNIGADHTLTTRLGFNRTSNGTVSPDLRALGLGEPELNMNDENGGFADIEYSYRLNQTSLLSVSLRYEEFNFGKSEEQILLYNGRPVRIGEPRSKTRVSTVGLSYSRTF